MQLKNNQLVSKIISWVATIALIVQVVLPMGSRIQSAMAADATLTIIAPSYDTSWDIGDTEDITWIISGTSVDTSKLYYSSNNGTSWHFIDEVAYQFPGPTQTYSWQIPIVTNPGEKSFSIAIEAWHNNTLQCVGVTSYESQITANNYSQDNPDIYENRIVYNDNRDGNRDVYMYTITSPTTGIETQITTDSAEQAYPAIYGDRIVYSDNRNGNWDIYMYDISTSAETQITTNSSEQIYPAIYGDRVIYNDDRNGNLDIYMYTITSPTTGIETQITTDSFDQLAPDIYGDRIVYYDRRNGNLDIYMYTITSPTTGIETQITTDSAFQSMPSIYGDRIVYGNDVNGNWDIYMYTIKSPGTGGTETRITTNSERQGLPVIYNDKIVWLDGRTGEIGMNDIFMYDISTNKEIQISTSNYAYQNYPAIYNNQVVWIDYRNGHNDWDIYMYTIDSFVIDYGPVNSFTVVAPGIAYDNADFGITATAKDQYDDVITNYNDKSVSVESTPGLITPGDIGNDIHGSWVGGSATYDYYNINTTGNHIIRVFETGGAEGTTSIRVVRGIFRVINKQIASPIVVAPPPSWP